MNVLKSILIRNGLFLLYLERSLTTTNRQVYPDLPVHSTESSEKKLNKLVKAIYPYTAAHRDELDLKE
ncbi:unnamed protein product, partial [Rotaria magnacalcarata]